MMTCFNGLNHSVKFVKSLFRRSGPNTPIKADNRDKNSNDLPGIKCNPRADPVEYSINILKYFEMYPREDVKNTTKTTSLYVVIEYLLC